MNRTYDSALRLYFCIALVSLFVWTAPAQDAAPKTSNIERSGNYAAAFALYNRNNIDSAQVFFKRLANNHPDSPAAWSWYAECTRRIGMYRYDSTAAPILAEAERALQRALALAPDFAFAHAVAGDLYNPQYSNWIKTGYDLSWEHCIRAISSDPSECNAWLTIWAEAIRRGEPRYEHTALDQLYETRFFPGAILAQNRFQMKYLPENALYITSGDSDTYPALALQQNESFRTDVAVVNAGMLELPWYLNAMCKRHNLPLPIDEQEMENFEPYDGANGEPVYLYQKILASWHAMGEKLGRPFTAAVTCDTDVTGVFSQGMNFCGGYYMDVETPGDEVSPGTLQKAMDEVRAADFNGPAYSERDKSAVRRSTEPQLAARVVFNAGSEYINYLAGNEETDKALLYTAKLRAFAVGAHMDKNFIDWLDEAEKSLRE